MPSAEPSPQNSRAIAAEPPQPVAQEQSHCTSRATAPAEPLHEQAEPIQHIAAAAEPSQHSRSRACAVAAEPPLAADDCCCIKPPSSRAATGAPLQQGYSRAAAATEPQQSQHSSSRLAAAGKLPLFMSVHVAAYDRQSNCDCVTV